MVCYWLGGAQAKGVTVRLMAWWLGVTFYLYAIATDGPQPVAVHVIWWVSFVGWLVVGIILAVGSMARGPISMMKGVRGGEAKAQGPG